jgi:hypothetical protein
MQWKKTDGTADSLPKHDCKIVVMAYSKTELAKELKITEIAGDFSFKNSTLNFLISPSCYSYISMSLSLLEKGIYYLELPECPTYAQLKEAYTEP